ncbi:MAG: hypothetical protein JJ879_16415 [Sneathiella sp.]|nr:hypothetical protein [Sneathiella sp.]
MFLQGCSAGNVGSWIWITFFVFQYGETLMNVTRVTGMITTVVLLITVG